MKQKIIKVGNSAAVTLPASFVREGNLKVGSEVLVEPTLNIIMS
jgi:antitoxin component of MazEF toxin-antitoxin module